MNQSSEIRYCANRQTTLTLNINAKVLSNDVAQYKEALVLVVKESTSTIRHISSKFVKLTELDPFLH